MSDFASQLHPGEVVIDDANAHVHAPPTDPVIDGERKGRGWMPRPSAAVYGSLPYTTPFPADFVIPRPEWPARVKAMEDGKQLLSQLADMNGLTVLDQNGTNFCWINAPTHCVELLRLRQGEPTVRLSPASVGSILKNYRNQGGWGAEGLQYIVEHGVAPQQLWPPNAIKKQYDTPESQAARASFRVSEWWDLEPGNFDQLFSALLLGVPVAIGLGWWSHEVTAVDPVVISPGKYGVRISNSWGTSWETNGRGILEERKARPDDAVAPRVASPTVWEPAKGREELIA